MARRPLTLSARWFALSVALLLSACSAVSIGYNNAPTLLSWRAAEYFDLDAAQRTRFRERLERVHEWHRRAELPQLIADLQETARRVDGPVSVADAEWLEAQVQAGYRRALGRIIDESADLLATLDSEQVAALERRLAENRAEVEAEWLAPSAEEVRRARYERILGHAEDWLGRFAPAQREWLQERLDAIPVDYRAWLAERARREGELVALVARIAGDARPVSLAPPHAARVRRWALDWHHQGRSPERQAQVERLRRAYLELGVELVNRATPEQRTHLRGRLESYASALSGAVE